MAWQHISDEDLERYYLGEVTDESDLAPIEEHLLACPLCVERAEEARKYVDAIRGAIIEGGIDLE
jgi:anti-sigma factor RsiW